MKAGPSDVGGGRRVKWEGSINARANKNAQIIIHESFITLFGAFSAVVGEHEAMNCLEHDASKATSGDLTAAKST